MTKSTSEKFTLYNFLMTCSIVIYHSGSFTAAKFLNTLDENIYTFIWKFFDNIGSLAMSFFFTTTGFFLYYNLNEKNVGKKLSRRIHSLLIPFLLWNLIYYILPIPNKGDFNLTEILRRLIIDPFDGPLWYMLVIGLLAIFCPIFIKIFKHKKTSICLYIVLCLLCFYFTCYNLDPILNCCTYGWYIERIVRYLPNYFIGALIGNFCPSLLDKDNKFLIYSSRLLFVLCFIILGSGYKQDSLFWCINRILPLLMWFTVSSSSKLLKLSSSNLFKSSFMIYALHGFILYKIDPIIFNTPILINNLSTYTVTAIRLSKLIIIVLISYLLYIILYRLCPKLLKLLTGGR